MSKKIPRIIHQVWFNFGPDESGRDIGDHNRDLMERIKKKNPGHECVLWREEDAEDLIKRHYPEYLTTYLFLDPIIRRVDYARFFILHKYGGIYLDMDYFSLKSFDQYFLDYPQYKDCDVVLSRSCYGPWITNSIMMSRAGCKFWRFCMEQVKNGALIPWWGNLQSHIETACTTGPHFMTVVHDSYIRLVSDPEKFHIAEPPLFVAQEFKDSVYTWHEGHTSWIRSEDFLSVEWIALMVVVLIVLYGGYKN